MLRLVLSAVALSAVFAAANPVLADPVSAGAPDRAQAVAAEPTSPAPASSLVDTWPPTGQKSVAPSGFGWG
jgi:hypothetical protein